LIAALLWSPVERVAEEYRAQGLVESDALSLAADAVISRQIATTALPRRFTQVAREIWQLQPRFQRRGGRRPERLAQHPRFRAAYDFLLLRARSGENVGDLADWWTEFVEREAIPEAPAEEAPAAEGRR